MLSISTVHSTKFTLLLDRSTKRFQSIIAPFQIHPESMNKFYFRGMLCKWPMRSSYFRPIQTNDNKLFHLENWLRVSHKHFSPSLTEMILCATSQFNQHISIHFILIGFKFISKINSRLQSLEWNERTRTFVICICYLLIM